MATKRPRIQAYVDLSTYESLKSQADSRGISVSELASELLRTISVDGSYVDSSSSVSRKSEFVTVTQLEEMLESYRERIILHVTREITRAQASFEAYADSLNSFNQGMFNDAFKRLTAASETQPNTGSFSSTRKSSSKSSSKTRSGQLSQSDVTPN